MSDWQDLLDNLQAWLGVAVAAGVPVGVLWLSLPAARRCLLPPRRRRAVPWDLPEVYVALGAIFVVPLLFTFLLQGGQPGFSPRALWAAFLAMPVSVAAMLLALRLRGARPYQAGLTTHRWRTDVTLGYLLWLVLTPPVLAVHVAAIHYLGKSPHPFERLAQEGLAPVEWGLVVFLAVVQAPLTEELAFRGILQPWAARGPESSHAVIVGAVAVSLLLSPPVAPQGLSGLATPPTLFALAMLPGYLLLPPLLPLPEQDARAIYATALLFAAFHAGAWPSPVALFLLGLGLGWLAWRTRSLTGPFTVHALFNAVASTLLLSGKG